MSTVLAAIDASAAAADAAALAELLADAAGAGLLLFAVHPSPRVPLPEALRPTVPPRARLEEAVARLAATLGSGGASGDARAGDRSSAGDASGDADRRGPVVETRVVDDRAPARAIQQAAEALPAAIVVLGASRRGRVGEATAGRVARQVLDAAPCPVAIAAAGLRAQGARLRRIVVGVDDSPEAQAAVDLAARLAAGAGAELRLIAVAEDELAPSRTPIGEVVQLAEWEAAVDHRRAHAERVLAQALERAAAAAPSAGGEVRTGDAAEELAAVACDGADLLVIGSRHWGQLSRIAVGSTDDELMRGAPCSLLLVPRPDGDG